MIVGALEAGGTKMVCAAGDENGTIFDKETIQTARPEETMPQVTAFFSERIGRFGKIEALGIGSFGPVDLKAGSETYGFITSTPKQNWQNYPLLPTLQKALNVPARIDTDVNVAAFAESKRGAAKGLSSCVYVTVGTGIGGGLVVENQLVHGLVHPEFGHFWLRPHPKDPAPRGFCPFHDGCLEGLATGPSIEKRWGVRAEFLPPDHPAWRLEAYYLAQMCVTAILVFSPEKIILGGGVMKQTHLFEPVRKQVREMLNGYVKHPMILETIDAYIVPPGCGNDSGIIGALLLGANAIR